MLTLVQLFIALISNCFKSPRRLEVENLYLRHQLNIATRRAPRRLQLRGADRALMVWMTRRWPNLLTLSRVVRPDTILRWHRAGFRAYWRWKSRGQPGRPNIDRELRDLIRQMCKQNPLWGAPRIHGELLKLGFELAESISLYCALMYRQTNVGAIMKDTLTADDFLWFGQSPLARCVRPIMFQTEHPEFPHATHGGSAFIVRFSGRPYSVTCRHVFGDFNPDMLFISPRQQMRKGEWSAKIQHIGYAGRLGGGAVGTDLGDVCVLEFADDLAPDFFGGEELSVEFESVARTESGHDLIALGFLKEKSWLLPPGGHFDFHGLPLRDRGPSSDPFLRRASARYEGTDLQTITGMSGGPVFNLTQNALCRMTLRGGLADGRCVVYYLDAYHILRMLEATRDRRRVVMY